MKILHIGYSDSIGGAAIGMMRIHKSLLNKGVDSNVLVFEKLSKIEKVFTINKSFIDSWISELKIRIIRQKKFFFNPGNRYSHSVNFFDSNILKDIKRINPDVINLHWINNELISIRQISKISKPIVWTMLDMWPMCGGEHYTTTKRYIEGYNEKNRDENENGYDLNRWIWSKKKKYYNDNINTIICISEWLKLEAEKSFLFKNKDIIKINLPVDPNDWGIIDKNEARNKLNLPQNKKIFLFISTNGIKDLRKGFNYVDKALKKISIEKKNILLLVVGKKNFIGDKPYEVKFIDDVKNGDPNKLKTVYSSADLLLSPSTLEAMGQVAVEALSCGLPVIGFNQTGFADIINHKKNGYLCKYQDEDDFLNGIEWILKEFESINNVNKNRLVSTVDTFSSENISNEYLKVYSNLIDK